MRRHVVLAACTAAFFGGPVMADPLSYLEQDALMHNTRFVDTVLCDTFEQALAIADAHDPQAALNHYESLQNAEGLPACNEGQFMGDILDAYEVGLTPTGLRRADVWVVKVRTSGFVGWTVVKFSLNALFI